MKTNIPKILFVLLSIASSLSMAAQAANVPIEKLYQSFEAAEGSTLQMPEFGKRVSVVATVLSTTESLDGAGLIVKLGVRGEDSELARASFEAKSPKLRKLKEGSAFKAECAVGSSSGTDWIPLQQCVIR